MYCTPILLLFLIGFSPIFKKVEFKPARENVGDYQWGLMQHRGL